MPRIYLDTNIFILAFEALKDLADPCRELLSPVARKSGSAVTSELTLAELLAPVSREGGLSDSERYALYSEALTTRGIVSLAPVSRDILIQTASLRSAASATGRKLKLPDSIHIATALASGCQYFLSGDQRIVNASGGLEYVGSSKAEIDQVLSALYD